MNEFTYLNGTIEEIEEAEKRRAERHVEELRCKGLSRLSRAQRAMLVELFSGSEGVVRRQFRTRSQSTSVSRTLRRLEERGYVRCGDRRSDRRTVSLTEDGETIAKALSRNG